MIVGHRNRKSGMYGPRSWPDRVPAAQNAIYRRRQWPEAPVAACPAIELTPKSRTHVTPRSLAVYGRDASDPTYDIDGGEYLISGG
jgi:hypothetical protein